MPRLIVLYNKPDDTDAFDAHYRDMHMPIVSRYPNLRDVRLSYLMAEMTFDTAADLDDAIMSEPGAESARDLRNFAGAGVTMFIAPDGADD